MTERTPIPEGRLHEEMGSRIEALRRLEAALEGIEEPPALPGGPAASRLSAQFLVSDDRALPRAQRRLDSGASFGAGRMGNTGEMGKMEETARIEEIGRMAEADAPSLRSFLESTSASSIAATACLRSPGAFFETGRREQAEGLEFWKSIVIREGSALIVGGRYAIRGLVARGGTSRVFRALDRKLDRVVALKIVAPPASEIVRQSLDVTLGLKHSSIVQVEQAGAVGEGGLYLAMPLLEGTTIGRVLYAREFAADSLLLALRRACEGVAHAHARGVVHRDLKPSNIQVEPDGRSVVLDWGLACRAGGASRSASGILGTPLYMAPEQIEGGTVSPRTDVFALGTILYELLTGAHPAGPPRGMAEIANRILRESPPPPSVLAGGVSKELDAIVLRSLAKRPEDRFADASELLGALDDMAGE